MIPLMLADSGTTPARPDDVHDASALPGELEALRGAISGAIDALVAWDTTALQSAIENQRIICKQIAVLRAAAPAGVASPATVAAARKVRELTHIYGRLLRHSIHWTRTMRSILEAGGYSLPSGASVHFRG